MLFGQDRRYTMFRERRNTTEPQTQQSAEPPRESEAEAAGQSETARRNTVTEDRRNSGGGPHLIRRNTRVEEPQNVPSIEQLNTHFIPRKSLGIDASSSSSEGEQHVLDIDAGEVDVHEYFKMQLHKHEDILREEVVDESKLPRRVRMKRELLNHARIFLAVFSQKFFLRHRSLITTFVEVFFSPLIVLGIMIAFTHGISWDIAYNERMLARESSIHFREVDAERLKDEFRMKYCDARGRIYLLYYPNTTLVRRILAEMIDEFDIELHNTFRNATENGCEESAGSSCGERPGLISCSSEEELLEMAMMHRKDRRKHREPIGLIFKYDGWENDTEKKPVIPKKLHYTIRLFNEDLEDTFTDFPYVEPPRSSGAVSPYVESGFLGLQYAVEEAYLELVDDMIRYELLSNANASAGGTVDSAAKESLLGDDAELILKDPQFLFSSKDDLKSWPIRTFRMYYYPNFYNKRLRQLIVTVVSFTLLTSYFCFTYFIVKQVVTENSSGIKDLLKLHNMPVLLHWFTLFLHNLLLRLITAVLITVILFQDFGNGALITKSSIPIIFFFIYNHMLAVSAFNFFIASVSDRIFLSGIIAMIAGFSSFTIPMILEQIGMVTYWPNLILTLVFPNWAFVNGLREIVHLECDDKGLDFDHLFQATPDSYLSGFSIILILSVSKWAYFILAVLEDLTRQKTLSNSSKWYQFRKKLREKKLQKKDHDEMMEDLWAHREDVIRGKPEVYEERGGDGDHHRCMVRVRHVTVLGGKHKIILSGISMNIYHGEITILLGHTGSGKTSLIHTMAGMQVPTQGYVTIHGFDANYERKQAAKYLGYCPQQNVLFNLLNVQEHVTICYRLRGLGIGEAKKHCIALMHLMRLSDVAQKYPSDLSETNRRKLSIALALVHAPKVMFLDEPTHGLDCISRREIWSILVELKRHHTIVIGTNRMDEAEYLGDRIALLSHGKLICCGTPAFLKSQYDTGYYLKLYPAENNPLDTDKIALIIERHVGDYPKRNQGGEEILESDDVIFELPKTKLLRFPELFDEIDENKESLGVDHYTVAQISLYDIFIRICDAISLENEPPDKCFRRACPDMRRDSFKGMQLPEVVQHEIFRPTRGNSAFALLHKRVAILRAKNEFFIWEYLFPIIVIVVVCLQAFGFISPIRDSPAREMSLRTYDNVKIFYRLGATDMPKKLSRDYKASVAENLADVGIPLLRTDQVLIKLEELEAWQDGMARVKYIVAVEVRQLERYEQKSYRSKKVKEKYLQFVGYHSSGALHSPPLVTNIISNIMLKTMFPPKKSDYQILVSSQPFPTRMVSDFVSDCGSSCVLFAVIASFGISFFVAGTIVVPSIERRTGMKHIQLMTGLHPVIHWGTEYLFEVAISFILGCIFLSLFALTGFVSSKPTLFLGIVAIGAILILYLCWSSLPFVFYLSTILPGSFSGYATYLALHMFLGWIPVMMFEIRSYRGTAPSNLVIVFRNLMHVFPMYTITSALHRWFEIDARCSICLTMPKAVRQMCDLTREHGDHSGSQRQQLYNFLLQHDSTFAMCCDRICRSKSVRAQDKCFHPPNFFDWNAESWEQPMIWRHLIMFAIQGFVYWGLLIFIERGVVTNMVHTAVLKFIRMHSKDQEKQRPVEITKERAKCEKILGKETFPPDIAMLCYDLTKSYATVMVVNDLSIAIKKGECIGVLGGSGSGKSTFIKLVCGETLATTGEVHIGDSSIHHNRVKFLSQIGYCPQNSCLFDFFTPEQMLKLMGRLRGIPTRELSRHVDSWLQLFGLLEAKKDQCKDLTLGMRRCVCAAMSLIGGCEIILMDEPTSGIDPASRHKLWSVIKLLTSQGRTVIFTSYNCDECSFLTSRMIVMCEGNVQCLGPPRELIQRFARGYTILIRVRHDVLSQLEIQSATMGRVTKLKRSMKRKFKHLTLRDEQDNLILYFLRDLKLSWGQIFRHMEEIGEENKDIIERYYISEATLDELFVLLTNKYREMDAPRKMEPVMEGTISKEEAERKALDRAFRNEKK